MVVVPNNKKSMAEFKYGDLIVKCHQCGGEEILEALVTDGRALYLFNHDDSYVRLNCPKCNITMEMKMIPSVNPPEDIVDDFIEDVTPIENEELPQEVTAEEVV